MNRSCLYNTIVIISIDLLPMGILLGWFIAYLFFTIKDDGYGEISTFLCCIFVISLSLNILTLILRLKKTLLRFIPKTISWFTGCIGIMMGGIPVSLFCFFLPAMIILLASMIGDFVLGGIESEVTDGVSQKQFLEKSEGIILGQNQGVIPGGNKGLIPGKSEEKISEENTGTVQTQQNLSPAGTDIELAYIPVYQSSEESKENSNTNNNNNSDNSNN